MRTIHQWIFSRSRREVLGFLGTGVAAIVAALWAAYLHFSPTHAEDNKATPPTSVNQTVNNNPAVNVQANPNINVSPSQSNQNTVTNQNTVIIPPKSEPELRMEAIYQVCVGDHNFGRCPKGSILVECGTDVEAWSAAKCGKLQIQLNLQNTYQGGHCGLAVFTLKCTASR
ncbi:MULTISPECIES: hypothetical protein [unclassified Bradyrhizobium]|uniref:hypothetical protein n=1 Tax=unclassified Bradyrhizobium TaxID=2631580 RepID=UPI001BA7D0BE|nr:MULTISPECIES: hypothetical protein [unclassified Bradyrhizobium]MBR1205869.1 hypothetical protein [Bradyrhizobium sp. AUGA SZCCT0124]MBR1315742.1 hypothetical protein [Bradyrhizobium sp. AUGA SZCCT0051]MBR1338196.1 hypothetical protein [Bradyrhizobium sp. AUGA SZCCT0105]MBR1355851.1 hypothetical protein [Bradyrhizobium sp. AUGA SZCCT0045]